MRVLVVDAHEDVAHSTCALLTRVDCHCKYALNWPTAVAIARSWVPQVVVIDLGIDNINSYYLAQSLRELPGLADVRVVGIGTGLDNAQLRNQTGVEHYLQKPVDPITLIDAIRSIPEHGHELQLRQV